MQNLGKIKCFLLDMDGTINLGQKLLPGAKEFIDYLK
jgi:ribonucleotide monophosphatase NagD (HAD superfamily)